MINTLPRRLLGLAVRLATSLVISLFVVRLFFLLGSTLQSLYPGQQRFEFLPALAGSVLSFWELGACWPGGGSLSITLTILFGVSATFLSSPGWPRVASLFLGAFATVALAVYVWSVTLPWTGWFWWYLARYLALVPLLAVTGILLNRVLVRHLRPWTVRESSGPRTPERSKVIEL